jgi:lipopolysaccharide export system permease protein
MIKSFNRLNNYIAKSFLLKFLQITAGFSLLIFFINLIEAFDKSAENSTPFFVILAMSFLQIPDFLNDVVPSLVLISAILTFFLFSSKSEITIARISGLSLWQIIKPVAFSAFFLGVFWVTIFGSISIKMIQKFNSLEAKYINKEIREVIILRNGIWLKQKNLEKNGEEIIIQAKKVYKKNFELGNATVWFFDKNGQFYKKIDAKTMLLEEDFWLLKNATLNDENSLNKKIKILSIPTNLKSDFVMQKIVNNFQNVKLFSVFELPNLIEDLKMAGFNSTKFKVYFNSLLSKPLLFAAMTLIACYFGLNHIRSQNSTLMIFLGIVVGLVFYIISSIMNSLGSSGLISTFASTWIIGIICLSSGILLIYRKENL